MQIQSVMADILSPILGLAAGKIKSLFEIPPNPEFGDLSLPCFTLAREMRKAPSHIAMDLAETINTALSRRVSTKDGIVPPNPTGLPEAASDAVVLPILNPENLLLRAEPLNGYLNLFYDRQALASVVVREILASGDSYGSSEVGKGKRVIVEFSSPNIAKPFHVGHLYSTVVGNSLEQIYRHLGYETIKINHLGDRGTQFGKLMVAWLRWGDEDAIARTPIREMLRIYVQFHEAAEQDPSLETEARNWFRKLEDSDPDALAMWKRFMRFSLVEFQRIYGTLDIHFDLVQGESFYQDKMKKVELLLREKGLLVPSDQAQVVFLEDEDMPPCLILKSDGASTYATRDLAAALFRKRTYGFDKCLYVVGTPQALHFRQVFSVMKRAGLAWASDCEHVGFGLVRFTDRKMATRTGDVVFLEDMLEEAVRRSLLKMEESPEGASREETAKMVGIGSVIYSFLKNGRDRDILFSWEDSLDFDGDSAPYIQYTYARAASILRKQSEGSRAPIAEPILMQPAAQAGTPVPQALEGPLVHDLEFQLVKDLDGFKKAVLEAADKNEPCMIARQTILVARTFNRFYAACPIRTAAADHRQSRILLTECVCQVLKTGMGLLGVQVPEAM